MSLPVFVRLGMAVGRRATLLELEQAERSSCLSLVFRDWARRSGYLRDRRQPSVPCTLVPGAGLRVDVLLTEGGWRYDLRRI